MSAQPEPQNLRWNEKAFDMRVMYVYCIQTGLCVAFPTAYMYMYASKQARRLQKHSCEIDWHKLQQGTWPNCNQDVDGTSLEAACV